MLCSRRSRRGEDLGGVNGVSYILKKIGVSVLFSGAAVGVSHVVQATRAGGEYGLAIIPVICGCLILKYPAFLFGPLYTCETGESVIQGYRNISRVILMIVGIAFLSIMFTVVAAVSMLSSGILIETTGVSVSPLLLAIALVLISTVASDYLSFNVFQRNMKYIFLVIVILSLSALAFSFPFAKEGTFSWDLGFSGWSQADLFFIAALIGWMPAGLGAWVGLPVGIALFLAIFSTLIVVIDGFPRVLAEVITAWGLPKQSRDYRKLCAWVQAAGAIVLLLVFISSLTALVDFATLVSFVMAPLFAFLNHRLVTSKNFSSKKVISRFLYIWSWIGILSFSGFTVWFLIIRFG